MCRASLLYLSTVTRNSHSCASSSFTPTAVVNIWAEFTTESVLIALILGTKSGIALVLLFLMQEKSYRLPLPLGILTQDIPQILLEFYAYFTVNMVFTMFNSLLDIKNSRKYCAVSLWLSLSIYLMPWRHPCHCWDIIVCPSLQKRRKTVQDCILSDVHLTANW